jgi:tRNA(Ile2) C34 agmatinyltransferase TiaS
MVKKKKLQKEKRLKGLFQGKNETQIRSENQSLRPDCPHCGTPDPMSYGHKWLCRGCNKQWVKFPVPKITNNPPCRFCGGLTNSNGLNYICKVCGKANRKVFVSKGITSIQELCMAQIVKI